MNMKINLKDNFLGISIIVSALIIGGAWIYTVQLKNANPQEANVKAIAKLEEAVLPSRGVVLPVEWGSLGKQMVDYGVIDKEKFESLYAERGGLDEASKNILTGDSNGKITITKENSGVLLNLFWAFGLANKNEILEKGEMTDQKYGGNAGQFASTGGWTLGVGNPMDHYSRHLMVALTSEQQLLVDKVSRNIYRSCCGNSTHFPDCNHGMAMLGLLELMASQGAGEEEMYKTALAVNSYWFPDTYMTIAQYLKMKGIEWEKIGAKEILGANFSSASRFQQIKNQIQPAVPSGGNSCGA